jgi:hypothetical protein
MQRITVTNDSAEDSRHLREKHCQRFCPTSSMHKTRFHEHIYSFKIKLIDDRLIIIDDIIIRRSTDAEIHINDI